MGDDVVVAVEAGVVASLRAKFEAVLPHLDERQQRLELRPQRRHHARLNSHYHIIAHEIPYEEVIYRRALSVSVLSLGRVLGTAAARPESVCHAADSGHEN